MDRITEFFDGSLLNMQNKIISRGNFKSPAKFG